MLCLSEAWLIYVVLHVYSNISGLQSFAFIAVLALFIFRAEWCWQGKDSKLYQGEKEKDQIIVAEITNEMKQENLEETLKNKVVLLPHLCYCEILPQIVVQVSLSATCVSRNVSTKISKHSTVNRHDWQLKYHLHFWLKNERVLITLPDHLLIWTCSALFSPVLQQVLVPQSAFTSFCFPTT